MVLLGFITQQLFASPAATSAIPVMVIPQALMAKDQVCQTLKVCDFSSKAPREPCFSLLRDIMGVYDVLECGEGFPPTQYHVVKGLYKFMNHQEPLVRANPDQLSSEGSPFMGAE